MDIEISSIKDIGLRIQLTTLQTVVLEIGSIVSGKRSEILALKAARSFGSEYEIYVREREIVGLLEAEASVIALFNSVAKTGNLSVKQEIDQ